VATRVDEPTHSGWSNGNPGIKWRFLDQGEGGWQASVFPQVQTGASRRAQVAGIGAAGPRLLLPVEVSRKIGPLDFDVEAGYYLPEHGPREHILGFATGRSLTEHLELDAELYEDRADHSQPDSLALDLGGRYILGRGLIALFMIGRSVNGFANGQPQFQGYFGIQILLSNYGRTLTSVP
jgi:hypothetical protein